MQIKSTMCNISAGLLLLGCAATYPAFDKTPDRFASVEELAKREATRQITCNSDGPDATTRVPPIYPHEGFRSGRVAFMFDLDDAGKPINIRITEASEETFVRYTVRSLEQWKYPAKSPTEPLSKRKNLCSSLVFTLRDDNDYIIPSWTDVVEESEAYLNYKAYLQSLVQGRP